MFGTGMPFNYPDPALVKPEVLDASESDKEKILAQNAAAWLRLWPRRKAGDWRTEDGRQTADRLLTTDY